ncbi:unnamed protein product, partial [Mesorhabditis spiculigera]
MIKSRRPAGGSHDYIELRAEYTGRENEPFEIQTVCIDRFGKDGYAELEDAGVTDINHRTWVFDGIGFDAPLEAKQDSMRKFAEQYIN